MFFHLHTMSLADFDRNVPTILATFRVASDPDVTPILYAIEDLWERKLWHQLTMTLQEYYDHFKVTPTLRLRFFRQFVNLFHARINQRRLVAFGLAAAAGARDSDEALTFLSDLASQVDNPENRDAFLFVQIELARVKICLEDLVGAKEQLDYASDNMNAFESIDEINALYYLAWAEYYKKKAKFTEYYRNCLLYLACIPDLSLTVPIERRQSIAYDLAVAALLGDKIYNFGELLHHPVLEALHGSAYQWLINFLHNVNQGNIAQFEASLAGDFAKTPLLQNSLPFIREKICLTALCEAIFARASSDRTLSFAEVGAATHLPADDVENLVMRALSLGLIQGTIDEVAQVVSITWLQPRVLSRENIDSMRQKLVQWDKSVNQLGQWIEQEGKDTWVTA
jgi:26S proteasome regulatory subunit N9